MIDCLKPLNLNMHQCSFDFGKPFRGFLFEDKQSS